LVERGPEKAGVGGSIPSLATILFNNLATAKKRVKISRANNTRTSFPFLSLLASLAQTNFHVCCVVSFEFEPCGSSNFDVEHAPN
jgi:hypothetical protein